MRYDLVGLGEEERGVTAGTATGTATGTTEAAETATGAAAGSAIPANLTATAGESVPATAAAADMVSPAFAAAVGARGAPARRHARPAKLDMLEMMQASMLMEMRESTRRKEEEEREAKRRREEEEREAKRRREDREDMRMVLQSLALGLANAFPPRSRPKRRQKRDGGSWGEISLQQPSGSESDSDG